MMKYLSIVFCFCITFNISFVFGLDKTHKEWSEILKKYQDSEGLVKYKTLKNDIKKDKTHSFLNYLRSLEDITFKEYQKLDSKSQMAFLINAYNSLTIKLIIDNYPVKSIKKIGSFFKNAWKQDFFNLLDGQITNLDTIEHKWLRPKFKDYRIHAAVNCASISCPALRSEAYVGANLDSQLNEQMSLWLNDKSKNEFYFKKNVYTVSKIFDWYAKDFESWGDGITNVIEKYVKTTKDVSKDKKPTIKYQNYNWDLNEAL